MAMNSSNWIFLAIVAVFLVFFLLKRASFASGEDVEAALKAGALIIDVRTPGEHAGGHLPGVTNVPLDQLAQRIEQLEPNRERPIALHCLSGARSASGAATLKRMGYKHVYNLGSYGRAEKLLGNRKVE